MNRLAEKWGQKNMPPYFCPNLSACFREGSWSRCAAKLGWGGLERLPVQDVSFASTFA